ncbi:hypothetical protein D6T64_13440 [Cryobacterium melibiosiphilum]|uniref:Uncharacterized protein n=1 Tax=Cryobacterium melibiosiphilum TaxID=995039 RepID=A0A3A5MKJ8_9MICO|nr:hypothetical protein D6T64_13440 [Cryobacterium melibiosiphilum]
MVLPAVAIVAVAWVVFWMAQDLPTACALVAPCPGPDVRVMPAVFFGGLMLAPLTAVILMSFVRSPESWLVRLSYVVLVLMAIAGYGAISFSGGFSVTRTFLLGLLGVCGTAGLAFVGTNALRRELSKDAYPEGVRFLSPAIAKSVIVLVLLVLTVASILFARSIDSGDTAVLKCSAPNDSRTFTPVCP